MPYRKRPAVDRENPCLLPNSPEHNTLWADACIGFAVIEFLGLHRYVKCIF